MKCKGMINRLHKKDALLEHGVPVVNQATISPVAEVQDTPQLPIVFRFGRIVHRQKSVRKIELK